MHATALIWAFLKQQHNWSISDTSVTFIDKTDPSDLLKTMALFGLNIEESVKVSVFGTLVGCVGC